MNRLLPYVLISLFTAQLALAGDIRKTPRPKKILPLDDVPGVVMKNRTNSHYLPDRVIIKLMPQTTSSLSKSALGIRAIDQVLSRVSVASVEPMFRPQQTFARSGSVDLSLMYSVTFSSPNDPFTLAGDSKQ